LSHTTTGPVISQGIGVVTGLQDKFNWAAVAAAGVGSAAGSMVGGFAGKAGGAVSASVGGKLGERLGRVTSGAIIGMADSIGNAAAMSLIEGTDFGDNIRASLPGVLGNAIAGGIGFGGTGEGGGIEGGNWLDNLSDGVFDGVAGAGRRIGGMVKSFATGLSDFTGLDGAFGYQGETARTTDVATGGNFLGANSIDARGMFDAAVSHALRTDPKTGLQSNFDIDLLPGMDDAFIVEGATFRKAGFEPYDDIFGAATTFEKMWMGLEAHMVLTSIASSEQNRDNGWWANLTNAPNRVNHAITRFVGRPDLGLSNSAVNLIWELKPDTPNGIALGEIQVKGYETTQKHIDKLFRGPLLNPTPYSFATIAPWRLGIDGLMPGTQYVGPISGNRYAFRFAGKGVLVYHVSRPVQTSPNPTPNPAPYTFPFPFPFPRGPRLPMPAT
jgi:hypothetical protein